MINELLINAKPYETRVALLENKNVVELYVKRDLGQDLVGNIYLGKVLRVLPGIQSAFVDIGINKPAFLYVTDTYNDFHYLEQLILQGEYEDNNPESVFNSGVQSFKSCDVNIEDLLKEGQNIMVQVSKEPIGAKGARLTSHITLPGRHLVFMPTVSHVGISRKIIDEKEKTRLRKLMEEIRQPNSGFIIRTAGEHITREKLRFEAEFLTTLWETIQRKRERTSPPSLLHKELTIILRAVRDLFTKEVDRLVIDSSKEYQSIMDFLDTFSPGLKSSVELYKGRDPLFDAFGIETAINSALDKKIWLKSGGYIIIETTEALTAIDVNTGSYVGKRSPEDTIVKTNLEAVKEIAYQLRFRNIGGLIVIDFIDMTKDANKERVFLALKEALEKDRVKTTVLGMSELGLIEMTRKRTRKDINYLLTNPCPYCEAKGRVKSNATICHEIFRDLEREVCPGQKGKAYLLVNTEIESTLKEEERTFIMELERQINRQIIIIGKSNFNLEQYEISIQ